MTGLSAVGVADAGPLHHHQLADILRRDVSDELAAAVDDADRRHTALLQQLQRGFEPRQARYRGDAAGHRLDHRRRRAGFRQRRDHGVAREHAAQLAAAVDHREFVLRRSEQELRRVADRRLRPERLEAGDHGVADAEMPRHVLEPDHLRLRRRGEIDEDGDEDEQRIAPYETGEAEDEGECLADPRGDVRRLPARIPDREHGAEHPSAVHRKGRNEIEEDEEDVHRGEPDEEAETRIVEPLQRGEVEMRVQNEDQDRGDDDVHRRPGERDQDFLTRVLRHALEPREPADRQKRDVRRADAVAPRRQRMAELVRDHAGEERQDEEDAIDRRLRPAFLVIGDRDPGEEQKEGDVNADLGAEKPADRKGPGHREAPRKLPAGAMRSGRHLNRCIRRRSRRA